MKTVRYRFLTLLIFALLIILLTVGLFADTYTKIFLQREFVKQTKLEVQSLERFIYESMHQGATIDDKFLKNIARSHLTDVAIYDAKGELLYANHQVSRSNIWLEVVVDKIEADTDYFISTVDNRFYYVQPLERTGGYLLYGTEYIQCQKVEFQLWGMIVTLFILCIFLCITFGNQILRRYFDPIDAVTNSLEAALDGDYSKRIFVYEQNETRKLTLATDDILRYMGDMSREYSTNEAWMKTLIENMSAGLILIDEKGYVQILNRYLEQLIHVDRKFCIGKMYHEAIEHKDITNMIEEVFMKEEKIEHQLVIRQGIKERYLLIHGAPIVSSRAKWRGVVVVFHDITTMKRLENMRKDFVANVSHELRTPVTSIKGFTETLLEGAYRDEDITYEFLSIMQKESTRMENLVKDLLELSQIEKQDFHLNLTKVDVTDIVENILKMLAPAIEEKRISTTLQAMHPAYILADEQRVTQVVVNILSNAKNYTPEDGEIHVEIRENPSSYEIEVEVRDTGIGIPEQDLPRIFERFYRADRARSRDSGGTGLGLSIVKHLMQAHQATVRVESKVGEGSTFTLCFPAYQEEQKEGESDV